MEGKSLKLLIVGTLSVAFLCVLYVFSNNISADKTGDLYDYECLIKSFLVVLISIMVIRILFVAIINPAEIRHNKKMPGILRYVVGALVLTAAAVYIVTAIYAKSAMAIFTTLGASGIGIAFIAQDTLKELIAGIIISFQNDFRVGDWIKLPDGTIAQILRTKLTCIDLALLNDTRLYLSNTKLTNATVVNLSQPTPAHFSRLDVVLEHDIPIEQARRILYAATASTPGLASKEPLVVADAVLQNGILFAIFFKIPSYDVGAEMKHRVISSLVSNLHKHGLRVCEIGGQLNIKILDKKMVKIFNDENTTDAKTALRLSGLLEGCDEEVIERFAASMEKAVYKAGEVVVKQGDEGDTMFIIAEGVVDVLLSVSKSDKDGNTQTSSSIVATLSDGDFFGEMSLLCGEKRNASVVAKSDVSAFLIKRRGVKECLDRFPDFGEKLNRALLIRSKENETMNNRVLKNSGKGVNPITVFCSLFKSF